MVGRRHRVDSYLLDLKLKIIFNYREAHEICQRQDLRTTDLAAGRYILNMRRDFSDTILEKFAQFADSIIGWRNPEY